MTRTDVPPGAFDATTGDPDEANEKLETILRPAPLQLLSPPPSVVALDTGYIGDDGEAIMEAHVRELTGEDEEFLSRELLKQAISIAKFVDIILGRTVVSIGDLENPTKDQLRTLLRGDRLKLAIAVRCLTYGDEWVVEGLLCNKCGQPFDVIIELKKDIEDYPVKNPRARTAEVELRNGSIATVSLITGADELFAIGTGINRTEAEQTTVYIDRCLRGLDGVPVTTPLGKSLGVMDRKRIVDVWRTQPGPNLGEVSVPCSICAEKSDYPLNMAELFRY